MNRQAPVPSLILTGKPLPTSRQVHPLQPAPIFDTNVFGDVQRALISQADWKYLLRHRPRHGWPLSQVTALELLVGVHVVQPDEWANVKQRIELAYNVSNGRVLNDPRFLLCKEVLRIPFPPDQLPPSASVISKYMDVVRRGTTMNQLLTRGVSYRGKLARINSTSVLAELMAGPKRQWAAELKKWQTNTIRLGANSSVEQVAACLWK